MGLFDSKQSSESTRRNYPWKYAATGLRTATGIIANQLNQPLQFFPGSTYAPQTEAELQQIQGLTSGAGAYPEMVQNYLGPATDAWQQALGAPGAALGMGLQDVMDNPALQGAAQAMTDRMTRNLTENILPNLTTQFMGFGGLGGTRQGIAEGLAVDRTQQAISEGLAGLYGNAWGRGLDAETSRYLAGLQSQAGALGRTAGLIGADLSQYTTPAALYGEAGGLERAEAQRPIDEAMARHQFAQMEPWRRAAMGIEGLMGPAQAFGASEAKNEMTGSPSTFSNIGNMLGAGSMLGGALFGGGGLLSGGGGLFSGLFGGMGGGYSPPMGGYGMYANPWTTSYGYY